MDKDKRLMEASWWKGLAVGKSGSCSVGKAMLSKSLIQFSAEGWGLRPNYGRGNGSNGDLLHKDLRQHAAAAPKIVEVSVPDPTAGHYRPAPLLETPGHSQANLTLSLVGSLILSPGSWCTQGFVCSL